MLRHILCIALLAAASPGVAAAQTADEFFGDLELGELRLFLHQRDWDDLRQRFTENTYYPADVHWNGVVVRNVGIRSRGAGSRDGLKPGLRVDVDHYAAAQEFLGLKSFVLDNAKTDASSIRERVAMKFLARMGIHAPRERHVVLYVNNEFAGIYAVVESIDKRFLARVYGGEQERVENDGYLFEYRFQFPYYFAHLGDDLGPYALLFEPRTREHAAPVDLWGPFEELTRRIQENSADGIVAALAPYLDVPRFIRYLAAEMFLAEFDGVLGHWGLNNFYVYRLERTTQAHFLPWDRDQTFRAANQSIWWNVETNELVRRLLEVPEMRHLYLDTLMEAAILAATPASGSAAADGSAENAPGWLEEEIARQAAQIRDPAKGDPFRRLPAGAFDDEVDRLLEFARARSRFVACEIGRARDPDFPTDCVAPDRIAHYAPE
jgi:hypothetical protein